MKKFLEILCLLSVLSVLQHSQCQTLNSAEEILKRMELMYNSVTQRSPRFLFTPYYKFPQTPIYSKPEMREEEKFDFIVIGSGSSGSVIANRLSENPQWKILLVEVGDQASFITDIPAIAPVFQLTNYNWGYLMEKQENMCLGMVDQRMAWPRGRAVGGTSIINYMIHVRGNRIDYDRWAAMGNPGWSYDDVLPYFRKMEDSLVYNQDEGFHGRDGPITIREVPFKTEAVNAFILAAQEAGHNYTDYNGRNQLGVSYVHAHLRNGKRCSVEKGYLRPILNRPNLKILTKTRATKILINPNTKSAYGIEYVRNRQYHIALASKEVIVSAGAFNSPQLLMLSGVGPKQHLQELGIPLLVDLPVGQKLYDHLTFTGLSFTVNQNIVFDQKEATNPVNFVQLLSSGNGPLTTLGGVEALLYFKSNVSTDPDPLYPDMELIFISGSFSTDKGLIYRTTFRITDEVYNKVYKPLEGRYTITVFPMLIHPKSIGYLRLKSKNPYNWPKFYGNFFTDQNNEDVRTFIAAIREVQRIMNFPSLRKYDAKIVDTKIPGCESFSFNSDEYWECALRHVTGTLHHQVSTCKMGPANDPEAVVDPKLQVYGIKNLRVADTSVIPLPLSAHTNTPAIMVGEKAADIIKADWSRDGKSLSQSGAGNIDIRRHAKYS